ncbi:MAG: hypothetical protein DLM57_07485 [Pseudonocardiales bacterium]|nr:MAG: hypothetical protein DLM57_07485 [Pseudonocardiales bacterium]
MTYRHCRALIAAGCIPVIFLTGGCSSSTSSKATTGNSAGAASGPNAHVTESAPPGDIPDTQRFTDYVAPDRAFSLKVPEGWARTPSGRAVVFSDKYNSVRIETYPAVRQPSVDSARASELPAVKAAAHGYSAGEVKTVQRAAGTAVLVTYRADSAPNSVTGKVVVEAVERYEFWRNGTEVVLTLSGALGADNVDPWRKVTDSFRWTA